MIDKEHIINSSSQSFTRMSNFVKFGFIAALVSRTSGLSKSIMVALGSVMGPHHSFKTISSNRAPIGQNKLGDVLFLS